MMESPFNILIGEQLSSVIFVQNYLQLDFDGNRLTCFVWPEVVIGNEVYGFGQDQYRNQLCSLIATKVEKVIFLEAIKLQLVFESSSEVRLSLNPQNPEIVVEIATFKDSKDNWSFF